MKANVKILLLTGEENGGDKEVRLRATESACPFIGATLAYADFKNGQINDNDETIILDRKRNPKSYS